MAVNFHVARIFMPIIRAHCSRCAQLHFPIRNEAGEWEHGVDEVGNGVYAPPEPCTAAAAHEFHRLLSHAGLLAPSPATTKGEDHAT